MKQAVSMQDVMGCDLNALELVSCRIQMINDKRHLRNIITAITPTQPPPTQALKTTQNRTRTTSRSTQVFIYTCNFTTTNNRLTPQTPDTAKMHFPTAILLALPVLALAAPRPAAATAGLAARAPSSITAEQPTVTLERRAHPRAFARQRRAETVHDVVVEGEDDDEEPMRRRRHIAAAASVVPRSHPRSFAARRARRSVEIPAMASTATAAAADHDVPVAIPRRHARAFPNRRSEAEQDIAEEQVGEPLAVRSSGRSHPRAWAGRAAN
ncbi:hypothetical protein RB601_008134 [Gaeumannomyces tritici]